MWLIYFIRCKKYVKIWKTNTDVEKRLSLLQIWCPYMLKVEKVFKSKAEWFSLLLAEKFLHDCVKEKNIHSEWFVLTKREVEELFFKLEEFENSKKRQKKRLIIKKWKVDFSKRYLICKNWVPHKSIEHLLSLQDYFFGLETKYQLFKTWTEINWYRVYKTKYYLKENESF